MKRIDRLEIFDYVLLAISMIMCALIGLYFKNKNKSMDSYMYGDRNMGVVPVAISLMTSCMSGLTLLGSSSEFYYQGPSYSFVVLAMILCGPIIAFTILPVFYRMNELSLHKYLQLRYGETIKYVISTLFIFQMTFYNAVVLYLPAMCLQAVIGIDKFYSILLIGIMCVLYSGFGGLKAVVWTDFYQAMLMYLSVIIVGALGTYDAGGFENVLKLASKGHRFELDGFFDVNLTTRHTLWGILLGSTIKHVYLVGVNQVQIQRGLSLKTLKQSQMCFSLCSFFVALISLLSSYMGLVLFAAYRGCDPYLDNEIPRRDSIIIHYIARRLSTVPGLRGVFVAGVFSATLSTLSSFSNSMAALAIEDFIKPLRKRYNYNDINSLDSTYLAKLIATCSGALCVLMAYLIDKANSRLLQATTTMFGATGVPFLACFALGIFTRFTNSKGIMFSLLITIPFGIYITIYQTFFSPPLQPKMPVYFDEYCAAAFNMTMKFSSLENSSNLYGSEMYMPEVEKNFSLSNISYMILPAVQFVLTSLIAIIVSILTGGLDQEVNEDYLISILHKKPKQAIDTLNYINKKEVFEKNTTLVLNGFDKNTKQIPANIDNFKEKLSEDFVKVKKQTSSGSDRKRRLGVVNRGFDSDSLTSQ